jgi:hypothetical protein
MTPNSVFRPRKIARCIFASALLAAPILPAASLAQSQPRAPTESELAEITARGRALAAYDFASWHGTDAVMALKPADGSVRRYIARSTPKGWVVAFGRLTAARDTFLVAFEAARTAQSGEYEGFTGVAHAKPIVDTDYYLHAARALDTASADFGAVQRPYNVAALPTAYGNWYVYLYPAPTITGVWPLGADTRYTVSADGRTILEKRRLHNSVIEFGARRMQSPAPGATIEAGSHTAVLAEIPEDTDVYHVITRTPRVPEYVMTDHFVYKIDIDGKINYLGTH